VSELTPEDVVCQICLEPLRQCVALIPCGHSFCAPCVSHYLANNLQVCLPDTDPAAAFTEDSSKYGVITHWQLTCCDAALKQHLPICSFECNDYAQMLLATCSKRESPPTPDTELSMLRRAGCRWSARCGARGH